jgi:hypothetical protein
VKAASVSRAFGAVLQAEPGTLLVGLENEYLLPDHFGRLIQLLDLGERNLDPGDPNAYRLPSGASITADGAEAEIALPPTRVRPGFTRELQHRALLERSWLARRLGPQLPLLGYSTHFSVSVPRSAAGRIARRWARTFGPAFMLLLEQRMSPGLLVRPRPGRLELCGEFADGAWIQAAAAMAVGSIAACLRQAPLPGEIEVSLAPAVERYGWYVDRRAFGPDLYSEGRKARLQRVRGGSITAQQQLEAAWTVARDALAGLAGDEDLEAADRMVAGDLPLPSEGGLAPPPFGPEPTLEPSVFGDATRPRERPRFDLAPVMLTWDHSVFLVVGAAGGGRAFVSLPAEFLPGFLRRLDGGELDLLIEEYLSCPAGDRRVTSSVGLYEQLGPRRALLAVERQPHRPGLSRFAWIAAVLTR